MMCLLYLSYLIKRKQILKKSYIIRVSQTYYDRFTKKKKEKPKTWASG